MWNKKSTLVFGASIKPDRYSNKAMKMLKQYDHSVLAIGGKEASFEGTPILEGHPDLSGIDTITMYLRESRQKEHEEYLLSLKPRRIIFNPGAENLSLAKKAKEKGIEVIEACTLVMLRTGQYS
ncbi:MAG: CoA-binding protein [Saprospiraceae bacterium]|nr:CoA-binding protein [Saprospiraceae bacterium]